MTIEYAILGLLSWKPLAGYDLKKIIADSQVFYWSGNNNQVYRSMVELHQAGLVSQEIQEQENLPARKIYTITAAGREALRKWVLSTPELPELHNTFLVQLAWADQLSDKELDGMLATYQQEVEMQLQMQQETARRQPTAPNRSARERYLWDEIHLNILESYQKELAWVRRVRSGLDERSAA